MQAERQQLREVNLRQWKEALGTHDDDEAKQYLAAAKAAGEARVVYVRADHAAKYLGEPSASVSRPEGPDVASEFNARYGAEDS